MQQIWARLTHNLLTIDACYIQKKGSLSQPNTQYSSVCMCMYVCVRMCSSCVCLYKQDTFIYQMSQKSSWIITSTKDKKKNTTDKFKKKKVNSWFLTTTTQKPKFGTICCVCVSVCVDLSGDGSVIYLFKAL